MTGLLEKKMMFPKKRPNKEEMSQEQVRQFLSAFPNAIPKKTWGKPRSKTNKAQYPEAVLQKAVNEWLELKKIRYLRFPDWFLTWMRLNTPRHVGAEFFRVWSGMPDNIPLIKITDGISLAVWIELKTEDKKGREVGRLHGKQKNKSKEDGWFVCRNLKSFESVMEKTTKIAEKIKHFLEVQIERDQD